MMEKTKKKGEKERVRYVLLVFTIIIGAVIEKITLALQPEIIFVCLRYLSVLRGLFSTF